MKKYLEKFKSFVWPVALFNVAFCVVIALANPIMLAVAVPLSLVFWGFFLNGLRSLGQRAFDIVENLQTNMPTGERGAAANFPTPLCVVDGEGEIVWHNTLFGKIFEEEPFGERVDTLLDGYTKTPHSSKGCEVFVKGRSFVCFSVKDGGENSDLNILYLFENTALRKIADEYSESRPVVMSILVDNYEDALGTYRDSEKARILGQVEQALEEYIGKTTGILLKLEPRKYMAVVEKRHLDAMMAKRFKILDTVRALMGEVKTPVTLSIGVGGTGATFSENMVISAHALDLALGRGGDQAAIKTESGYDFFGGVSKGVEKRTKVKARVIASSLRELIGMSDRVICMGHKFSDLDAVGASAAMARCVQLMGKKAYCVLDERTTLAGVLADLLVEEGHKNLFISPAEAEHMCDEKTMVIVVDCHTADMVDVPVLLEKCQHVVVIDHHRRRVDRIQKGTLFYHEPYVSSASEMVTELLGYLTTNSSNIEPVFAAGLLSGIVLDTKNFAVKTGVRTFEAAASLRRLGADTVEVKKMFSSTLESYINRSKVVSAAETYNGCAISAISEPLDNIRVVAAQAADELLEIAGVQASFVLYKIGSGVNISARSMGEVNVQLVLEALGGGGHHTMAGAQLDEIALSDAVRLVKGAIDRYLETVKE